MAIILAPVIRDGASADPEAILTPITLWPLGTIGSVHVLPGRLDMDRFKTAVGMAAGRMRMVAGRYGRRPKGHGLEYFVSPELSFPRQGVPSVTDR